MIIAIDGPSASGKGTIGALVANHLGFHHLDTGLLYRAVAQKLLEQSKSLDDITEAARLAEAMPLVDLDDEVLGAPAIGNAASKIAANRELREALVDRQRQFAAREPGTVLVGRDIGSVICPDADVKIYLTADVDVRAKRRADQLGVEDPVERRQIRDGILDRDHRDMNRAVAPMRQADDARLLDTTDLDIETAFRAAIAIVEGSREL
ncbi:MAG: (d)CMP kinase [Alphaproteobacteria bacterium]